LVSLVEQPGGSKLLGNLAQAEALSRLGICPPEPLRRGDGLPDSFRIFRFSLDAGLAHRPELG